MPPYGGVGRLGADSPGVVRDGGSHARTADSRPYGRDGGGRIETDAVREGRERSFDSPGWARSG